jgi:CDP-diacylglycerol--glycerol-3-phosphate 3-phosphatidyltransferase
MLTSEDHSADGAALAGLEARCRRAGALGVMACLAGGATLSLLDPHAVARWLGGTLPAWLWLWTSLWQDRRRNRRGDGRLLARLGPATTVTLARGLLVSFVAGFLLFARPDGALAWAPAILYTLAALADRLDGALARRTGWVTQLGAKLDVGTDALGLLMAPAVGVRWGRLPPWYLLLALAYPAFRAGLRLRAWRGRPLHLERLRRDPRARFFAGVQMTCVATALYPVLPAALIWPAATLAMMPTLALFVGEWRLATRD